MRRSSIVGSALVLLTVCLSASVSVVAASQQGKFVSIGDDPGLGNSEASVTIIEFGDYQCPMCRLFWKETLPRIKKEYVDTGKVRLVFRDFPQSMHPEAAAMAAECAEDQGQYCAYHDKIFREQNRRGREGDVVRFRARDLKRWGADIGLDTAAFDACVDSAHGTRMKSRRTTRMPP